MSDTPRTDAFTIVPLTEMLAGYRFRHYPQCDTEFARQLERELHSAEQALSAEKAKVFSAWVDMERIGDELGLPLEGLSPDAIIKEIARLKSTLALATNTFEATKKELSETLTKEREKNHAL